MARSLTAVDKVLVVVLSLDRTGDSTAPSTFQVKFPIDDRLAIRFDSLSFVPMAFDP